MIYFRFPLVETVFCEITLSSKNEKEAIHLFGLVLNEKRYLSSVDVSSDSSFAVL